MNFTETAIPYHQLQESFSQRLFRLAIRQIRFWYPRANIHVLTNKGSIQYPGLIYHFSSVEEAQYATKLEIYSLLDKPAMYMDTDILLLKPFSEKHLQTNYAFKMYTISSFDEEYPHYNSGIVWIAHPDKQLANDLFFIHNQHFRSMTKYKGNDEFALSFYITQQRWQMSPIDQVNKLFYELDQPYSYYQSIHYYLKTKYTNFLPDLVQWGHHFLHL